MSKPHEKVEDFDDILECMNSTEPLSNAQEKEQRGVVMMGVGLGLVVGLSVGITIGILIGVAISGS